jgi:hypothetical protein
MQGQRECAAGFFKIDFGALGGEAEGWDVIPQLAAEDVYELTDLSGTGDNDVMMTSVDFAFTPNNPVPRLEEATFDGIEIPPEALADYLYKTPDTAGTSALLRFDHLDAGTYRVTIFEGRLSDGNGQYSTIWSGDNDGSGEPDGQNTGSYAGGSATVTVAIQDDDVLWYRHFEDSSGGISGMIILPVPGTAGDFNNDDAVNFADFVILSKNFNTKGGYAQGDFDYNGKINLSDFVKFRQAYLAANAPAAASPVPEPGGFLFGVAATLCLAPFVRKRPVS